jgi:hypothetical protein
MKIALIKQVVYQDLYVCENGTAPLDLLFSSIMRVGPIGLFTLCEADFFIVDDTSDEECSTWKKVIPDYKEEWFKSLKKHNITETDFPTAKFLKPGSLFSNGEFSMNVRDINWNSYDIVISINISIPTNIVLNNLNTLWCYMIGEANILLDKVHFSYDVSLNQENRGLVNSNSGFIDFPYTFIGPYCLENLIFTYLRRKSLNLGIYAEINTTIQRPVVSISKFDALKNIGHPLNVHQQLIKDNLVTIYDSKYFVKLGGRFIRGNSIIEAISLGTLVLANPHELNCTQILPKETWVFTIDDIITKIKFFDSNPHLYNEALEKQRILLKHFIVDCPLESLKSALKSKRLINLNQNKSEILKIRKSVLIFKKLKFYLSRIFN